MVRFLLLLVFAVPVAAGCRCNHSTKWWLSAIAVLAASSVYASTDKSLEETPPPGNNYVRGTGIAVTQQLGVHFGVTGAALTAQWFFLHYWGRKHPKLEPIFTVVNYGGALALTTAASVELSQSKALEVSR